MYCLDNFGMLIFFENHVFDYCARLFISVGNVPQLGFRAFPLDCHEVVFVR
jgi:hypothetical protein